MALLFTARVFCVQAVAALALVSKVLNATDDLDDAPVQGAAARVQNAAVPDQNVAVPGRTVVAQTQNVGAVDHAAVVDHATVVVHDAAVFPRVARALNGKMVAHICAQVDQVVALGSRFAPGVQVAQIARGDPFPPAAGSVPGAPAVHFVQADLFSRAAPDVPQGYRSPLQAVWWEQLTVVALAANH